MTSGTIGDSDVVVVYGDPDLSGHIDLVSKVVSGRTVISYLSSAGHTVVQVDGGARRVIIHIVDTITAYKGWKGSQGKDSSLIFGP
jgi:hypothetical protein